MQGLRILGQCQPNKLIGGCNSPFTAHELEGVINRVVATRDDRRPSLIPGRGDLPPFPSVANLTSYLAGPEGTHIGMIHWRNYASLVWKPEVIRDVIDRGYFSIGQDYAALVLAINKMGLTVIDVNF